MIAVKGLKRGPRVITRRKFLTISLGVLIGFAVGTLLTFSQTEATTKEPLGRRPERIRISEAVWEEFSTLALETEGEGNGVVKKWVTNPQVKISGEATPEDRAEIRRIIEELNSLTALYSELIKDDRESIKLSFVAREEMNKILSKFLGRSDIPRVDGFYWVWWDEGFRMSEAQIFIPTDLSLPYRLQIIRHELTHTYGLMGHTDRPDSILYRYPLVSAYSEIDEEVVKLLYNPLIKPGMDREAVLRMVEVVEFIP